MRPLTIADRSNGRPPRAWQTWLRKFFSQFWVEISIGVLVIVSVALTLIEFTLESQLSKQGSPAMTLLGLMTHAHLYWIEVANDVITGIFVIELALRFFAASSKRRFFAEFWLDILATLPLFRVFRSVRALRLLRLVRLVRLLGVMSRLSTHYPYVFRRGALDFMAICGLLSLAVAFGTAAMMQFENGGGMNGGNVAAGNAGGGDAVPGDVGPGVAGGGDAAANANSINTMPVDPGAVNPEFNLENAFWFSTYTLFAGEPVPSQPKTLMGKIVTVFLMFMGLTIFAIFAGTVSAFMVDRIRVEGRVVEWDELNNHIVICGWTPKTEIIIREYRASKPSRNQAIVVICETASDHLDVDLRQLTNVYFVHDDFTKVSALNRAGIPNAATCIVLSDTSCGRSEQDADARTILAALTVEKINENVYTCAELMNRSYATHLDLGKVNEYVVSDEYGAYMMAQAAMNRGLIGVLGELLSYQTGNEFYRAPIPKSWVGENFDAKLSQMKTASNVILVGVHHQNGEAIVNPANYKFEENDEVVVISDGTPKLI